MTPTLKADPWLYLDLYELIAEVAETLKPSSYLEVGVDTGGSLTAVLDGWPHIERLVLSDTWSRQAHHSNVHISKLLEDRRYEGVVVYLDGSSQDLVPSYMKGQTVDLAFVDGDHSYASAKADIANVWPHVNTAMLVHDIFFPEVWQAFREFCTDAKPRAVTCHFAGHGAGLVLK